MSDTFEHQPQPVGPATAISVHEIPQFAKAEYAAPPGVDQCRICSRFISGEYYRVNNQMACSVCAQQALNGQPQDSHSAFARGLLLGSAGAVAGLILYATVAILTGWTIGYLALAVGWLVGKGIIKGSNGLGGRRYQIAALILTYFAISMAAVPIGIVYAVKHHPSAASKSNAPAIASNQPSANPSTPPPKRDFHLGKLLASLLFMGLASPFLEFTGNVGSAAIGLFILFLGLRIAWALTAARGLSVDGPFAATAPAQ